MSKIQDAINKWGSQKLGFSSVVPITLEEDEVWSGGCETCAFTYQVMNVTGRNPETGRSVTKEFDLTFQQIIAEVDEYL